MSHFVPVTILKKAEKPHHETGTKITILLSRSTARDFDVIATITKIYSKETVEKRRKSDQLI